MSNPHANCRAEIGVKTVKRALAGNTPDNGDLNTDSRDARVQKHSWSCHKDISCMFARPIQDLLPVLPGKLRLHDYWDRLLDDRERTMTDRGSKEHAKWSEHSRPLTPLMVGDKVRVQNQSGLFPRRWDKLGIVTEVRFACSDPAVPPYGTENSSPLHFPCGPRMSGLLRYIPLCPTK